MGWDLFPPPLRLCRSGRESLKVLGTVGEPINPEAWQWYYTVVGDKRCPIVDTFWQTETVRSLPEAAGSSSAQTPPLCCPLLGGHIVTGVFGLFRADTC